MLLVRRVIRYTHLSRPPFWMTQVTKSIRVRYAAVGERLDVTGSTRFGPWCWLQVSDGWLIDTRALSSKPLASFTFQPGAGALNCYQANMAYVAGTMNVRAAATIESAVVAKARSGDVFTVSNSAQGATWCWLKIDLGWLAKTARVQSSKPLHTTTSTSASTSASTETQQTRSDIDNCCFVNRHCQSEQDWVDGFWAFRRQECSAPGIAEQVSQPGAPHYIINSQGRKIPIYGDEEFRLTIARGFYYLRDKLPQWWQYVAIIDDVKYDDKEGNCGYACASWPYKNVRFGPHAYEQSARSIAQTLIHETCHLYQWQEGRGDNYDWSVPWEERSHEIECENKEREAGF